MLAIRFPVRLSTCNFSKRSFWRYARRTFLGLKALRARQWLELRKIVAKAREKLCKQPGVDLTLPPSLIQEAMSIRVTLSTQGLAARLASSTKASMDELMTMLERNAVTVDDIDAVIAVGNDAIGFPVAAALADIFSSKLKLAAAGTIAATTAAYAEALGRSFADSEKKIDLSYFLSDYREQPEMAGAESTLGAMPLVAAIAVEERSNVVRQSAGSSATAEATGGSANALEKEGTHSSLTALAARAKLLIDEQRYLEAAEVLFALAGGRAPHSKAQA